MLTEGLIIPANFIIHRLEALTENAALADRAFTAVGDILDLTVVVHILEAKVADFYGMRIVMCGCIPIVMQLRRCGKF